MGIPLVIGVLFFFLGLALIVGAVVVYFRQRREFAKMIPGSGVVTELTRHQGRHGYLYHPVVEFEPAPGQKTRFESATGSLPAGYAAGAAVKVMYDPNDPQKAEIDSGLTRWFYPGCLLGMGGIFSLIGLCLSGMMLLVLAGPR